MRKIFLPVVTIGLSSMLLQIAGLRQLLSAFSGNELDIGITLSVWLTAVGMGSFAGFRLKSKNAFALSFIGVGLMSQPTIILINMIRPVLSRGIGETISLPMTISSTVVSLLPICFVIGMQFPLAVSYSGGKTAKVYSLEAAGAFIGGTLFTFILSGRVDVLILSASISMINLLTGISLIRKKSLIPLLLIPAILYFGAERTSTEFQWSGFKFIKRIESRYGEITVLKMRDQLYVYSTGKFQFSYPDPQTEELRAHLPMSIHPSPSRVLMIGGSPAVLRELLKYPVSHLDFIEIDPFMITVSFGLLGREDATIVKDRRLRIISEDARRFIKELHGPSYDLIVSNLPEPATANINRFYTTDFFKEVRVALNKGGIFSLILPTSSGYIGRRMQVANGSVYNSLGDVFKKVGTSSAEYGYLFASDGPVDTDPSALKEHFSQRRIRTEYFLPYILDDAFSPLKVSMVRERLEKTGISNSDIKPVAYLYNLMLWAEVHEGRILNDLLESEGWRVVLSVSVLFLIFAALLWGRKEAVYFSMFTTGYSAMGFSLVIILAYQAAYGYVYEMMGLLTALFMLGMAFGVRIIKNSPKPLKILLSLEAAAIVLFISAGPLLQTEVLFYAMNLVCGMLAGMQFAAVNMCMNGQETAAVAGKLYAIDLTGSFLGSFLSSILLIPLLGIQNMLLTLVSLKIISFLLLLSVRHEKN